MRGKTLLEKARSEVMSELQEVREELRKEFGLKPAQREKVRQRLEKAISLANQPTLYREEE